MLLAACEVVAQQDVEHLRGALHVGGHHLDEAAALGVHGGQPHHLGVVLAQTFRALDGVFLIADLLEEGGLLGLGVGEIGAVFRGDLVQRRLRDIDVALVDEGGGEPVEHGQHQCADLVAVHVGIGTDDDFIEAEIVEVEGGKLLVVLAAQLHAAAHDLDEVHDDVRLEDAGIVGLEAVQDLAADGHNGLIFTVAAGLDRTHSRIALDDIQLTAGGVLGSAVHELLHPVREVDLGRERLFDALARFFGVLTALLVHQHLLTDLLGLVGLFEEVDFQIVLEEVGHGLRDELVGDGLFGLVLIAGAGGEAGRNVDQTVLHILKADGTLSLFVEVLLLQILVDLVDEGRADGVLRAAAMLQPGRVVVVFQQLHLVGEAERRTHLYLIVRLVFAVTAGSFALAAEHRGQAVLARRLSYIVGDAVLIAPALLPRLAGGGVFLLFVGEVEGQARVDDSLTAEDIFIVAAGDVDVGKDLIVRLPVDDAAGAAALVGFFVQAAHVLALLEVEVVVEAVPVDVSGHPCRGVLGGAEAQTVQTEAEFIVVLALAVLAACVHLAEQQLPVVALFPLVPVHGHTAAKVLDDDAAILAAGDVDGVAVAVAGLVDGVGDDLKDGVGAALHAVRAEDDGRALAHTVGTLQRSDAFVAIFLFSCHAAPPGPGMFLQRGRLKRFCYI